MISTLQGLILFLLFILPGSLMALAESYVAPKSHKSDTELLINSLAYSVFLHLPATIVATLFLWNYSLMGLKTLATTHPSKATFILVIYLLIISLSAIGLGFHWGGGKRAAFRAMANYFGTELKLDREVTVWDRLLLHERPKDKIVRATLYVKFPDDSIHCYVGEIDYFPVSASGEADYDISLKNVRYFDPEEDKLVWVVDAYDGMIINSANVLLAQIKFIDKSVPKRVDWRQNPELMRAKISSRS